MDERLRNALDSYLTERADRPFGDVESISGQTLQPFSEASQRGAGNLLDKAAKALAVGDDERARRLVDRAARMPYDRHEGTAPAAWAVHMKLFCLVTDTLEQSAIGDPRWLDAAIAVLDDDGPARFVLRDVLTAIDSDYEMNRDERSRLCAAIAVVPVRVALRDLDLEPAELADHVVSVLVVCNRYTRSVGSI